jgi:RimJ/RimL family protein N-acetyltransferase
MDERPSGLATGKVRLRDIVDDDLPVFFEFQLDPEAGRMAAFEGRERASFMAHWRRILVDESVVKQTVLYDGQVAGNIVSFEQAGQREVGYWLGRAFWGKGVATRALSAFLELERRRPLYGYVASHNIGSLRVLEKCGFTLRGEKEGFSYVGGDAVSAFILVLEGDAMPE